MKKCTKCEREKELIEFHNWKQGKDGLCNYCKECISKDRKRFLEENGNELRKRRKEVRDNDSERFKKYQKDSYQRHVESRKERQRLYNEKNKEYINEKRRIYYTENKEKINKKQNAYLATEKGKQYSNEYYHRTKERFDLKIKARNKLRYAVRVGNIMKKESCEKCFEKTNLHGHHEDYNKPLDVIWLCPKCHKLSHKEN